MEVESPARCSGSASSSPEFEFWMVRNHRSIPPPDLLTADELFVDGVLLPLQLLSLPCSDRPAPQHSNPPAEPTASILYSSTSISSRWKDLFKSTAEKKPDENGRNKKGRRSTSVGSADLNINLNIWPFTRSRSNGELPGRMRRRASAGGSAGVYLGGSGPVVQLRHAGVGAKEERLCTPVVSAAGGNGGDARVRVINLNVNSCIGNGNRVCSAGEDCGEIIGDCRTAEGSVGGGGKGSIFHLRTLFSKKFY